MPGYVKGPTATAVLPFSLCRAYAETQVYAARENEYHDGSSQRMALVTRPRHSWRLSKRLSPTDLGTLRTFWLAHVAGAFYFYNLKEGTYDPTGASTTGRYAVRFNSDWSESIGIALSDAPLELIEVAGGSEVTDPIAELYADRTGVWMAYSSVHERMLAENLIEGEQMELGADGAGYGLWGPGLTPSYIWLITTSPFRVYPYLRFSQSGPNFPWELHPALFSAVGAANCEWMEARMMYSYEPSAVAAAPCIAFLESAYSGGYEGGVDDTPQSLCTLKGARFGGGLISRDNLGTTIPDDIGLWKWLLESYHSMRTTDLDHPSKFFAWATGIAVYCNAARVNCGGADLDAAAGTGLITNSGIYTWGADRRFTGGAAQTRGGAGLYASERRGTSFRYVLPRSLFFDEHPTSKSRIRLLFKEQEFASAGQRAFDVDITPGAGAETIHAISGLDLYAAYGGAAHASTFEVTVNNRTTDGQIYIDFRGVTGEAICNAIAQEPMVVEYGE